MIRTRSTSARALGLMVSLLLTAAVLAGCGSDDEAGSDDKSGPSAPTGSDSNQSPEQASGDPLDPKPLDERAKLVLTTSGMLEFAAPLTLALEYGELEKENLDVTIEVSLETLPMLLTGQSDGAWSAPSAALLNAISSDVDVRWIAGNFVPAPEATSGLWMRTDLVGDPPDPGRLKGARISATQTSGGVVSYFIDDYLDGQPFDITSIEAVQLSAADALIALENGGIDGAWLNDPLQNEISDDPDFIRVTGQPQGVVGGGLLVGERLLRPENAEITEALVRALARTIRDHLKPGYHDDAEIVADLARIGEIPEEAITGAEEPRFQLWIEEGLMTSMQRTWMKQGALEYSEPISEDRIIDRSFVENLDLEPSGG